MKPEPTEYTFHETTEKELAQKIKDGGYVEYYMHCPICDTHGPHRHYICSVCGQIDFASKKTCLECWDASEIFRIRRNVSKFWRRHGYALKRVGVSIVLLTLFTIANWRVT